MLTSSGFSNDSFFAHPQSQKCLAEGIVDFVSAGVV
jgi:hypothetical protein